MIDRQNTRIAILNDLFKKGGVERIVSYMSTNLFTKNEGVIFLFDDSEIDFEYRGQLVSLGVNVPPYDSIIEESVSLFKALYKLVHAKKKYGVQVCISHKEGPNFINVLSNISKAIVTVHEAKSSGIKYSGIKHTLVKYVIKFLYNKASFVVAVSQGIAQDLVVNFGVDERKIKTIYNPCDISMIENKIHEPIDDNYTPLFNDRTVITAGRLHWQKGQWHLIRAFKLIKKHLPDVRLLMIGDGDQLNYLQELVMKLGLKDSVYFLGFQKNPFKFINHSDVFVLTSLWEGLPGVLLEAMACKVPVISTDCPSGPRELLAPKHQIKSHLQDIQFAEYGILTPPVSNDCRSADDPISHEEICIAEAIIKTLGDSELRRKYINSGYIRVQEFSIEKYVAQWNQLIRSV